LNATEGAAALAFLNGGGESGALIRALDWSATPLGGPAGWPQQLKTLAALVLNSRQAMLIAWGGEQTILYNDAYAELCGERHPRILGRPYSEAWAE